LLFLGGVVTLHAVVWTYGLSTAGVLVPPRQIAAEILSTFALVAMSCNLILSTRARPIERGLQGLDKLFVTHRTIGLTVAALVTVHFSIVPKSVGWVASKPVGYATIATLLTAVLVASAPRFPWRRLVPLRYETWKATHRFMGFVVAAAALHSLLAPTYVRMVPALATYVYSIALVGLAAYAYRETLFARVGPFARLTVGSSRHPASDVLEVSLDPGTDPFERTAGQFVCVSFAGAATPEQHPFTISSGAGRDVRLSIKGSGDFTKALVHGVADGSDVVIEGPYGRFDYTRGRRRQLWIAGGIGITPFLAMAADLEPGWDITLVWSVHDRAEAVYTDELLASSARAGGLSVVVHATSELGHVDVAKLGVSEPARDISAFICGPLPMRRAVLRQLKGLGVPRSEIYYEEFRLR